MLGESSLQRYLLAIQSQWDQVRNSMLDIEDSANGQGIQPPEIKSNALATLYIEAAMEISQAGLSDPFMLILETLHLQHEEILKEAWYCRNKRVWCALTWDEAKTAWHELDKFVRLLEARLATRKVSEVSQEPKEKQASNVVVFNDNDKAVVINGQVHSIDDDRAYRLFKIVAEGKGAIVSRKAIIEGINALKGKNTMANTKKKLPKCLQYCLKTNYGREGGYTYREPKK